MFYIVFFFGGRYYPDILYASYGMCVCVYVASELDKKLG